MAGVWETRLLALSDEVLRMATTVEDAVGRAMRSLQDRDPELARAIIEGDERIDAMQVEIEEHCLAILALEHPVASDLRMVTTALKIVTDLERIADYASNIAKVTLRVQGQELLKPLVDIPKMAEIDRQMLRSATQAFLRKDVELAAALIRDDDQVDALYNQVFRDLLERMIANPRQDVLNQATQLILAARYLERIGDHVTNFAEWIYFMVTGDRLVWNG
jgi:phosphate transport system protein